MNRGEQMQTTFEVVTLRRPPIVYSTPGVIVDPVPNYGGLLNGAPKIGFDADNNVLISYYKLDRQLNTQVYVAAPGSRKDAWTITQVSQ